MAPKRLANLAGNSYVSSSALAKILESVKHNPELLNESTSRYTLKRCREEEVVVTGIYGDLVKEMHCTGKDGNPVTICYADPVVTVDHLARISPAYRETLRHKAARCSPVDQAWQICVYADEVLPGNVLRAVSSRKCWAVYWTFLQLEEALGSELCWNTFTVATSDQVKRLEDGLSQLMREVFRRLGGGFQDGVYIEGVGILKAELRLMISDEGALKQTLMCKGASGNKCCIMCRNCVLHASELWKHGDGLVSHVEHEFGRFRRHSDETLWSVCDHLAAKKPHLRKGEFAQLEQSLGMNFGTHGCLFDLELRRTWRPISMVQWDWMHCLLVQGIFQLEATEVQPWTGAQGFDTSRFCVNLAGTMKSAGFCV